MLAGPDFVQLLDFTEGGLVSVGESNLVQANHGITLILTGVMCKVAKWPRSLMEILGNIFSLVKREGWRRRGMLL